MWRSVGFALTSAASGAVALAVTDRVLMLEYANNGNTEPAAVVGIVTAAMVIAIAVVARRFGLQIGRPR